MIYVETQKLKVWPLSVTSQSLEPIYENSLMSQPQFRNYRNKCHDYAGSCTHRCIHLIKLMTNAYWRQKQGISLVDERQSADWELSQVGQVSFELT